MMLVQQSLTIRPDAPLRQRWFGPTVMRHPAKQSLYQLIHLLNRFSVPGGVLLDPFGGSGSSMTACAPSYGGMYVVTVELAAHFLTLQDQAWQHFQCSMEMQDVWDTQPGDYLSLQGDSRDLASVLSEAGMVDLIITSPPYQDALHHDQVGAAIKRIRAERGNKGNGNVSAPQTYDTRLIAENENIGNLKGKKYLDLMAAVWQQCAEVLKPGGILCCITRDCVRKGQRVPVGEQNKALLLAAGLEFIECETWDVPNLSF